MEPVLIFKEEQLEKFAYLTILTTLPQQQVSLHVFGIQFTVLNTNFLLVHLLMSLHEYNAPCAICFVSTRATAIMVPAKTICPSSWTREYYGYLTANYDGHHRSSYNCLDISPGIVPETGASSDSAFFYYTATACNGLSCPPYENNRILSCVVCTK